jgi:hypothetical protein
VRALRTQPAPRLVDADPGMCRVQRHVVVAQLQGSGDPRHERQGKDARSCVLAKLVGYRSHGTSIVREHNARLGHEMCR